MSQTINYISSDFSRYVKLHKRPSVFILPLIFFHNPGMLFSILYRFENLLITHNNMLIRVIGKLLWPLYYLITYFVLDIDIDPTVTIGKGFYVHNRGIIVASTTTIGNNCSILGPATIGINLNEHKGPSLRNNVTVCTGARIIGNILIGNNVIVGANSVVLRNTPSGVTVGGVPAKILKKNNT